MKNKSSSKLSPATVKALTDGVFDAVNDSGGQHTYCLPEKLRTSFEMKVWEHTTPPMESFYDWLTRPYPGGPGCGVSKTAFTIKYVLELLEDEVKRSSTSPYREMYEDLVRSHRKGKGKGGDRKSKEYQDQVDGHIHMMARRQTKCTAATLAARMAESKEAKVKAAWEGWLNGTHRTITAAATAAGLIKPRSFKLMDRFKTFWKNASQDEKKDLIKFIKANP